MIRGECRDYHRGRNLSQEEDCSCRDADIIQQLRRSQRRSIREEQRIIARRNVRLRALAERARELELEQRHHAEKKSSLKSKICSAIKVCGAVMALFGLIFTFYIIGIIIIDDASPLDLFNFSYNGRNITRTNRRNNAVNNTTPATINVTIPDILYNNTDNRVPNYAIGREQNISDIQEKNDFSNSKIDNSNSQPIGWPVTVKLNNDDLMSSYNSGRKKIDNPVRRVSMTSPKFPIKPYISTERFYLKKDASNSRPRSLISSEIGRQIYEEKKARDRIHPRRNYRQSTLVPQKKNNSNYELSKKGPLPSTDYDIRKQTEDNAGFLQFIYKSIANPFSIFSSSSRLSDPRRSNQEEYWGKVIPKRTHSDSERRHFPRGQNKYSNLPRRHRDYLFRRERLRNGNRRSEPKDSNQYYGFSPYTQNIHELIRYIDMRQRRNHQKSILNQNLPLEHKKFKVPGNYVVGNQNHVFHPEMNSNDYQLDSGRPNHPHPISYPNDKAVYGSSNIAYDENGSILNNDYIRRKKYYNTYAEDDRSTLYHEIDPAMLNSFHGNNNKDRPSNVYNMNQHHTPAYSIPNDKLPITKSKKPMSVMVDIYPKTESIDTGFSYKTKVNLDIGTNPATHQYEGPHVVDLTQFNEDSLFDESKKQEMLLHINLFSRKPNNKRSYLQSSKFRNKVGIEVPISGRFLPIDILKSLISQAKLIPVAAAQTLSEEKESSTEGNRSEKREDFAVEEGMQLYNAIEASLKELNKFLPENRKFPFPKTPPSPEDLVSMVALTSKE